MSVSTHPGTPSAYVFDNNDPEAVDRHSHLTTILDGPTFARLAGLGDLTGKRCLEVGAGGGSVAVWLANQVGPTGRVVATDINTKHIRPHPGFELLQHDLTTEPVPDGPWDIIHARLVLLHLPERREILTRLAAALAPGGVLLLEEWETTFRKTVLAAPDAESAALMDLYHSTLIDTIMPTKGNDPTWAGKVHAAMLEEGLIVDTQIHAGYWPGGTAGALLLAANIGQLREDFLAVGVTEAQLDAMCELVTDPRLVLRGQFTYSTAGRKPAS